MCRKFGKHLQKRQLDIPEYGASFVNYKALKKLIKKLSATPVLKAQNNTSEPTDVLDPQASLQANKATFFFRLERELEKVNAFYLQKEAELQVRLRTLLDKKRMMQSRQETTSKVSSTFITLEEGFQQFNNDLNKLQQFVEVNATAFSKILKKWDKTSKSRTKELYLSRAVDVQPCFNRDVISELSDQATTSLLELGAWAEGEKVNFGARSADHTVPSQRIGTDENDTDSHLLDAINSGNISTVHDWIRRLRESPNAKERVTRTFLTTINEAPEDTLDLLLATDLVDIQSEDEINERNVLHEAAISGRMFLLRTALSKGVKASRVDVYGRIPLHYACMHGRVDMLQTLVESDPQTVNMMDHDNFTPLIHAVVHHQLSCVQRLISFHAKVDPNSDSDHIPLNLACQHGCASITEVLLKEGAKVLPDAEGLYPQHLVARSGKTPELLLILKGYGVDLNEIDKMNQWTPLFHASSEGHVACLQTLLDNGARVDILDEKGLSAMYYAAWEGYLECMRLLGIAGAKPDPARLPLSATLMPTSVTPEPMSMEADSIPNLVLPPPILPLRRYGHNFLDNKTFIQINFEGMGSDPIIFYHDSKYPAARLTISSKHSDLIPRNVLLPFQEDTKIISFQIDNLESFAIDFDVFPTFGARVIAKTVALPSIFSALTSSSGYCCLPLFDPRLRAIGQVSFTFQVIKPFHGIPLEITHFATYWKATSQDDDLPAALITGSSLSGEYVRLCVQLTNDGVPVICPFWTIDHGGINIPISQLTHDQFRFVGKHKGVTGKLAPVPDHDIAAMHRVLAASFCTLEEALAYLPASIHAEIHALYPTVIQEKNLGLGPAPNLNTFADNILKVVFEHTRHSREEGARSEFGRGLVFSSFNPDICTALNWKQPNYPVFLCNALGAIESPALSSTELATADLAAYRPKDGNGGGKYAMSVKEAVRIAQTNNFMGLICSRRLLDMVPALIRSVKVAGLVLVMDTAAEPNAGDTHMGPTRKGVDGVLRKEGVLKFEETINM